jgi:hypothetical protein
MRLKALDFLLVACVFCAASFLVGQQNARAACDNKCRSWDTFYDDLGAKGIKCYHVMVKDCFYCTLYNNSMCDASKNPEGAT